MKQISNLGCNKIVHIRLGGEDHYVRNAEGFKFLLDLGEKLYNELKKKHPNWSHKKLLEKLYG